MHGDSLHLLGSDGGRCREHPLGSGDAGITERSAGRRPVEGECPGEVASRERQVVCELFDGVSGVSVTVGDLEHRSVVESFQRFDAPRGGGA